MRGERRKSVYTTPFRTLSSYESQSLDLGSHLAHVVRVELRGAVNIDSIKEPNHDPILRRKLGAYRQKPIEVTGSIESSVLWIVQAYDSSSTSSSNTTPTCQISDLI